MKKKFSVKSIVPLLKKSFTGFSEDKVLKLSGSLAYSTIFSLAPLLVVIISICSVFLGQQAVQGTIYTQIKGFVGADAAAQLQDMIKNASLSGKGTSAAIIGGVTLVIGATAVFGEIQDSINTIWGLKPTPKAGMMKMIKNRLLSFGMIGSLGFLLLVSLGVSAVVDAIGNRLKAHFPDVTVVVFYILNLILTLGITTVLFGGIFKVLPDAKIKWKDIWVGAITTAVLFMLGRLGISLYISKSNIGSTYGSAGALAVMLVWIYYSAVILYFGAEFTKYYVLSFGSPIRPNQYAVAVSTVEVEQGKKTLQEVENNPPSASPSNPTSKPSPGHPRSYSLQTVSSIREHSKDHPQSERKGTHLKGVSAVAVALVALLAGVVRREK